MMRFVLHTPTRTTHKHALACVHTFASSIAFYCPVLKEKRQTQSGVYHTIPTELLPDPSSLHYAHPARRDLELSKKWEYTNNAVLLVGWGAPSAALASMFHLEGPLPADLGIHGGSLSPCSSSAHCARQNWSVADPDAAVEFLASRLEATEAIRQNFNLSRQPIIIAMTGHALAGVRDSCLAGGMNGFVAKPISLADVRTSIVDATESVKNRIALPR